MLWSILFLIPSVTNDTFAGSARGGHGGDNSFMVEIHTLGSFDVSTCFAVKGSTPLTGADPGFGHGGAPASEAEGCRHSEAESRERSEHSAAGVQGPLKGPGSFWVFDAQICILTHSRDSFSLIFDIYFDTKS